MATSNIKPGHNTGKSIRDIRSTLLQRPCSLKIVGPAYVVIVFFEKSFVTHWLLPFFFYFALCVTIDLKEKTKLWQETFTQKTFLENILLRMTKLETPRKKARMTSNAKQRKQNQQPYNGLNFFFFFFFLWNVGWPGDTTNCHISSLETFGTKYTWFSTNSLEETRNRGNNEP